MKVEDITDTFTVNTSVCNDFYAYKYDKVVIILAGINTTSSGAIFATQNVYKFMNVTGSYSTTATSNDNGKFRGCAITNNTELTFKLTSVLYKSEGLTFVTMII